LFGAAGSTLELQRATRQRLSHTVADLLVEGIREQGLGPGTRLPSERELMRRLHVGRSTVREALNGLALSGVLEIRHGQGVFVASRSAPGPEALDVALERGVTRALTQARLVVEPALAAIRWLDRDTGSDGDGFHRYRTRSPQGTRHQAWKDSGDAVVDENGCQVDPPIATCEEQAFVYIAKLHLSEVMWWLDRKEEARALYREAGELKKRFNEAFWMEREGTLAMALAGGRQIRAISSNPGHCIAAGIVDEGLVARAAERLLAPDLFSGWGVRTLSSDNPAYNPFSYHRGSVWPVEQGTFAFGFTRYGLHEDAERISGAQFEAAALFEFNRLPEVFSGHSRDREHPFPAFYPRANSPQAWSASAVITLLQAMLGLYPYAPLHLLLVDPHLPEWLPEITLSNLRVGGAAATIRFYRSGDSSGYEVLDKRGALHVVRQPSPWSLTATFAERLKDLLVSLLPGK
jgi:DNA-binding transcriptional regulator YhcF (GntR family)